jgi:hypothetical protein
VIQPSVFTCKSSWHADSALECGRCGVTICPDCLVHTPGGMRCKPCANLKRPPMYELSAGHYALAVGIALLLAIPMGVVGALFIPPGRLGFFGILIGFFIGSGIGSLLATAITRVTRGKRGTGMQLIAVAGIVVLLLVRQFLGAGLDLRVLSFDLVAPVTGFVAASVAWQRLR